MKPSSGLDMSEADKRGEERGGRNEAEGAPQPTRTVTRTGQRKEPKKTPARRTSR